MVGEAKPIVVGEMPGKVDFSALEAVEPCSWVRGTCGHKWPITVQLAKCGGCGGWVLARRQENCPWCNEPTVEMRIRVDQVGGGNVVAICKGERNSMGSSGYVNVVRTEEEVAPSGKSESQPKIAEKA